MIAAIQVCMSLYLMWCVITIPISAILVTYDYIKYYDYYNAEQIPLF